MISKTQSPKPHTGRVCTMADLRQRESFHNSRLMRKKLNKPIILLKLGMAHMNIIESKFHA